VRLLFDENLSPRLTQVLADVYPDAAHVHDLGLGEASDTLIWEFAAEQGYTIVSKDADFHQRSFVRGAPPKVIWLRLGNSSVATTADLLRSRYIEVQRFHEDTEASFLALS
jgi:predicted nuclease of predicted toxin-antitoxin system